MTTEEQKMGEAWEQGYNKCTYSLCMADSIEDIVTPLCQDPEHKTILWCVCVCVCVVCVLLTKQVINMKFWIFTVKLGVNATPTFRTASFQK